MSDQILKEKQGHLVWESAELLQYLGTDAAKWAAEFQRTATKLGYSTMDAGWLIGWFANAIEARSVSSASSVSDDDGDLRHIRSLAQMARNQDIKGIAVELIRKAGNKTIKQRVEL